MRTAIDWMAQWRFFWLFCLVASLWPLLHVLTYWMGIGVLREDSNGMILLSSLLLVGLPILGLAALIRHRLMGLAFGIAVWSALLSVGFPRYFDQEEPDAMDAGLAWWSSGGSTRLAPLETIEALAFEMDASGEAGAVEAAQSAPVNRQTVVRPILMGDFSDEEGEKVFLPYEGKSRTRKVMVTLEGENGATEDVVMLFDTGATMTTVHPDVLKRMGVRIGRDNPVLDFLTANGRRRDAVTLLDRVWLAGMPVDGVTVAACEDCASKDTVGLLGLNVTGQFQVTLDSKRQVIALVPHETASDRQIDVSPWVELRGVFEKRPSGRLALNLAAENRSHRAIESVQVGVECGASEMQTQIEDIGAGETGEKMLSLPHGTECSEGRIELKSAIW